MSFLISEVRPDPLLQSGDMLIVRNFPTERLFGKSKFTGVRPVLIFGCESLTTELHDNSHGAGSPIGDHGFNTISHLELGDSIFRTNFGPVIRLDVKTKLVSSYNTFHGSPTRTEMFLPVLGDRKAFLDGMRLSIVGQQKRTW